MLYVADGEAGTANSSAHFGGVLGGDAAGAPAASFSAALGLSDEVSVRLTRPGLGRTRPYEPPDCELSRERRALLAPGTSPVPSDFRMACASAASAATSPAAASTEEPRPMLESDGNRLCCFGSAGKRLADPNAAAAVANDAEAVMGTDAAADAGRLPALAAADAPGAVAVAESSSPPAARADAEAEGAALGFDWPALADGLLSVVEEEPSPEDGDDAVAGRWTLV